MRTFFFLAANTVSFRQAKEELKLCGKANLR